MQSVSTAIGNESERGAVSRVLDFSLKKTFHRAFSPSLMAEARIDEEEEELRELRDPGVRRNLRQSNPAADRSERNKPEHRQSSQGPLSSIRAAIKRTSTRSNSQSDNQRDRRRPEITILSAEPLATNAWFPGASGGFPPPPPPSEHIWGGSIPAVAQPPPSYDQVIREKTQEQGPPPAATPRRSTTTIATQTEFPSPPETPTSHRSVTSQGSDKKGSVAKRPPKPPRPAFPSKPLPSESAASTVDCLLDLGESPVFPAKELTETNSCTAEAINSPLDTSCKFLASPLTSGPDLQTGLSEPSLISLDFPPGRTAESTPSPDSKPTAACPSQEDPRRPRPRPRSRPHAQPLTREVKVQTLVRLRDDGESAQVIQSPGEGSSSKYLQELLEVFGSDDQCFLSSPIGPSDPNEQSNRSDQSDCDDQSDRSYQSDNSDQSEEDSMSTLRTKIQAFEKQASSGSGDEDPPKRPEPRPRAQPPRPPAVATKPSVPAKPSLAPRPSNKGFWEKGPASGPRPETNNHKEVNCAPTPAPRPLLPKKSAAESDNKDAPVTRQRPPRPSIAVRAKNPTVRDEGSAVVLPAPPVPAKPSANLIDLNSQTPAAPPPAITPDCESKKTASDDVPAKRGSNPDRPSVPQKPTVIRVPSRTGKLCEDDSADPVPPLPVQKPVGGLPPPVAQKPSPTSKPTPQPSTQESTNVEKLGSSLPEKSLPPRPSGGKVLPPRPPPAKGAPARPPPPQTAGPKRPQSQGSPKKGPALPPRPSPGHPLYGRYTKNEALKPPEKTESSNLECQLVDIQSRPQKPPVKVVAPLVDVASSSEPQAPGPKQAQRESCGLQAQVLHDFTPEGPDELALRAGDTVSMVERVDGEWYRGTCRGSSGIFPVNHVKVLSNSPAPTLKKEAGPVAAPISGPRCVARFDFDNEHGDELPFSEGTVIRLKEYLDQEWARGDIDGRSGIFPLNFVEVVEDLPAPLVPPQPVHKNTELPGSASSPPNQEKDAKPSQRGPEGEEWATALYDFTAQTDEDLSFQQGARILIMEHVDSEWCCGRLNDKEGLFPKAFVQICTAQVEEKQPPSVPDGRGRARALFSFTSECEEELSVKVGDIITNLESIDEEWFFGELNGRRGLIPKNYVQVLQDS
ncbi:SH3 domain-containing protein 19-like isoform X2 [Megalops cyprinoides]|uniref:SH3 domain-containing protein 19-like isoform X2 n=1 Tax=Megalops cyprinoides TaxID=118141 RepID=UPI001864C974|nr:SH3 domain-containing protein 19-like isoform X2 [Megalops cyprinoides]